MQLEKRRFTRLAAVLLAGVLLLALAPAPAFAAVGARGAILLDGLRVRIRDKSFTPSGPEITSEGVVYTIDDTNGKLTGLDVDCGHVMWLSFKTKRNNSGDGAPVPITYEPVMSNPGEAGPDNGDWSADAANPDGYLLKGNVSYTYDKTSDPNYYLYKFRFHQGALDTYDENDFTDYILKVRKLPKADAGVFFNYLYVEYAPQSFFKQLHGPNFAKKAAGKEYREYLVDRAVKMPVQVRIVCSGHSQVVMKIDGKAAIGKVDKTYTLTEKKPYVEISLTPSAGADTETTHYVKTLWRIGVEPKYASVSKSTVGAIADKAYTGKQIKPAVKVKLNGKTLKKDKDYTLSYGANKKIGKGTVTIKGKGDYTGTKKLSFNIVPKKTKLNKASAGKGQVKLSWSKVSAAQKVTKYQLRYRVKGTSKWKTKTISAKSGSYTLKNLKKGMAYQFQVRSYKTVSKVKYYSAWSATKTSKKVG